MRYLYTFLATLVIVAWVGGCAGPQSSIPLQVSDRATVAPYIIQSGQSPGPWRWFGISQGSNDWATIAAGPSNTLWETNPNDSEGFIQVVDLAGGTSQYTMYGLLGRGTELWDVTEGPDGRMWFADLEGSIIALTPSGVATSYPLPSNSGAFHIVSGPDGNLWATVFPNAIARITTSGAITEFTLSDPNSDPEGIVVGPDGALWFAEFGAGKVGRITTDGSITEYAPTGGEISPDEVAVGNDGNIWFSEHGRNSYIGAMKTSGVTIGEYFVPFPNGPGVVYSVSRGPKGNIWFCGIDQTAGYIGQFTKPATWTFIATPGQYTAPNQLIVGPDQNLWLSNGGRDGTAGQYPVFGVYLENILTVSPTQIYFDSSKPPTKIIKVKETPHGGTWTAVSSNLSVATVSAGPQGNEFTVTAIGRGICSITVQDALQNSFIIKVKVVSVPGETV